MVQCVAAHGARWSSEEPKPMTTNREATLEERLRAIEDRLAIYQIVSGYSYAVDGGNAAVVGSLYAENGVYDIGDLGVREGRQKVAAITREESHMRRVHEGAGHVSTLPYVVIEDDRAVATSHHVILAHRDGQFIVDRLSACRFELSRKPDGDWEIDRRTNRLMNGDGLGPALLARLTEGPGGRQVRPPSDEI
jgi:hypothetical protein